MATCGTSVTRTATLGRRGRSRPWPTTCTPSPRSFGTSPDGVEAAVANAVTQAAKTVRNLDWFEVQSVRGQITDGAIAHWQVTVKLGFRLDD